MECFACGARLSESDFCNACGVDVRKYKKIMYAANRSYNDGLERASVRDLTGAVHCLKQCLKYNKNHIDARNLLGLIYFETGETVAALSEWVISKNIRGEKNIADEYIDRFQSNQGRLETMSSTIKKFNNALGLCYQGSYDLAAIQLKKVLSLNPKYLQAHKLLALLYFEKADYDKSRKELERVLAIDRGEVDSLCYLKDVESILNPLEGNSGKGIKIFDNGNAQTFKSGNETIIQPLNDKEPIGISALIQIGIGILLGLCITYFAIVPAKIRAAQDTVSTDIATYGDTIEKKNAEISELESRVAQLEQDNISLQGSLGSYEGNNGIVEVNNYLIAAALAYIDPSQDVTQVESYLELINPEYVDDGASYEFKELYNYILSQIGDSVAQSYYDTGLAYFNSGDYAMAITNLSKAVLYNPNSDDALYYLAMSYYENGDINTAQDKLNQLIVAFPTSSLVEKATQRLEEMNN